jgi:ribonuclease HI
LITSPSSSLKLEFKTTNNEAKYEAVIAGLGVALEMGAELVEVKSNFQMIAGHIKGEFKAKGERMKLYWSKVQNMQSSFQTFCIVKIPREENEKVDRLARLASADNNDGEEVEEPFQVLTHPSISEKVLVSKIQKVPNWQKEIIDYLEKGVLPSEKKSAIQLRTKAARFTMGNGILYKRVSCYHFSSVFLVKMVIISFMKFMKAYVGVT